MKDAWVVGVAVLVLLGSQVLFAGSLGAPSVRDENRRLLIGMEGGTYSPSAPVHVVSGAPHDLLDAVLPAAQALELHLDHLEEHNVRIADLLTRTASTSEPEWPLLGSIQFHEKGWLQSGAHCPTIAPEQEATIEDVFDTALPGEDDRLGLLTTSVSEFPQNEFGSLVQSAIEYWAPGHDPATEPAGETWWYTNWTLEAGFLIDYFCREPTGTKGVVFHDSFVTPYVDRTDD